METTLQKANTKVSPACSHKNGLAGPLPGQAFFETGRGALRTVARVAPRLELAAAGLSMAHGVTRE